MNKKLYSKKSLKVAKKGLEYVQIKLKQDWEESNMPIKLIDSYINAPNSYKVAINKINKLIKKYLNKKWKLRQYFKDFKCLKKYKKVIANNFLELFILDKNPIQGKLIKKYDIKYSKAYNKNLQIKEKILKLTFEIEKIYNNIFKIVKKHNIKHII